MLVGVSGYALLTDTLRGEFQADIEHVQGSAFLLRLYSDPSSVAPLPPGFRVELKKRQVDGNTEEIGVFVKAERFDRLEIFRLTAQADAPAVVEQHLHAFEWIHENRVSLPRPRMAAVVDYLIAEGVPIRDDGDVHVQVRRGEGDVLMPLRASAARAFNETYIQALDRLRIILYLSDPAPMSPDDVVRSDRIVISKVVQDGAVASVVVSGRGQDWSLSASMALNNGDPNTPWGKDELLRPIEASQRRKWEEKVTSALAGFLETRIEKSALRKK